MIKQTITDEILNTHLAEIEPDKIDVFLLNNGTIRGALLHDRGK
jgi:hypothetical protein